MKRNWRKNFPNGKVSYGYDDKGYFFFDTRTKNILLEIKEKRIPEELLEAIKSALNGRLKKGRFDIENSYQRNKKVNIIYKGRRYPIEFGVSYYLQFVCPKKFDKYEAHECEEEFVNEFIENLQILIYELV